LHPRGAARAGLGLPARRRHPAGERARPAAARQGRARRGEARDRDDRPRRRLQGRDRAVAVSADQAAAAPLRRQVRRAVTIWRRSIQARVVISTLLLSAVVVSLVGWVLLQQITDGLVRSKTDSSVAESSRATAEAQRRLSAASGNDFDASTQLTQLVSTLVSRGSVQGYEIVLTGPIAGSSTGVAAGPGTSSTPGVQPDSIPGSLRSKVEQS